MFKGWNCTGTMFYRAKAQGVVFEDTILREAKFLETDLRGAEFIRCDVTQIVLEGANIFGTTFVDCKENGNPITRDWLTAKNDKNAQFANIIDLNLSSESTQERGHALSR